MKLWSGRWVKFLDRNDFYPEAFHARDGKVVGIYCGKTEHEPAYIAVVDSKGFNLMIEVGGIVIQAKVSPDTVFLDPVLDRRDIPPERISHLPHDWQPRAG